MMPGVSKSLTGSEALQQLAQHLALGRDEPLVKLAFHALEVLPGKRSGVN